MEAYFTLLKELWQIIDKSERHRNMEFVYMGVGSGGTLFNVCHQIFYYYVDAFWCINVFHVNECHNCVFLLALPLALFVSFALPLALFVSFFL
jgi:hypothetical protein